MQMTLGLLHPAKTLESQISLVNNFEQENFLKQSNQKCEIVQFSQSSRVNSAPQYVVDGSLLPVRAMAKI